MELNIRVIFLSTLYGAAILLSVWKHHKLAWFITAQDRKHLQWVINNAQNITGTIYKASVRSFKCDVHLHFYFLHFTAFSRCFCPKRLTVIHTYIHTMVVAAMQVKSSFDTPVHVTQIVIFSYVFFSPIS